MQRLDAGTYKKNKTTPVKPTFIDEEKLIKKKKTPR